MLRIDINLVFTIINLLIFYVLLKRFLFKPVVAIMEKRKALIEEQLANAADTEKEANALKANYEETFKNAETDAAQIVAKAKDNAKTEYERIVSEASERAGKILEEANKNIELQREKTLRSLETEIAGLAMTAAQKVVRDQADAVDNIKLYDEFLNEAGDAHDTDIH